MTDTNTLLERINFLEKENKELKIERKEDKAYPAHNYHFAGAALKGLTKDKLLGSGVLVELTYLGGKEVCSPFLLLDGLEEETIKALLLELKKSWELATLHTPIEP